MFATPHLALGLGAIGRYAEALQAFADARAFGQRYGVVAPLARSISMSPVQTDAVRLCGRPGVGQ